MRFPRTLSTRRLLVAIPLVTVLAALAAVLAVAAAGGGGATPAPAALPDAVHRALTAPAVDGITARVTFTNKLFPSGALLGSAGPALIAGGSGRLWLRNDGSGRLELQSGAGDAQVVWNSTTVTVYDASSNTAYRASLPPHADKGAATPRTPPSLATITDALARLATRATVSGPTPTNLAGQPAYAVSISPKHDGGLLGSIELAWDAARGIPLRVGVYAQGSSAPVLELVATDISYGPVSADAVAVAPPAGAKTVDLGMLSRPTGAGPSPAVSGLAQVKAAAGFAVAVPPTLVGLPLQDVRLVGGSEPGGKAVLAVYGKGLGAIVVVERKAGSASKAGLLAGLPTVSLGGTTARELATQLGTVLAWERGGVAITLAGSIPTAAAEAAARELG